MRIGVFVILTLVVAFTWLHAASNPVRSQESLQLEELRVDLWPEYDRPGMLVIYQGILQPDTPLPATVTLRIPARVGQPHAVAYNEGEGDLLEASYTMQRTADWVVVTLRTPRPNFQLEFYDNLAQSGEQRSYTFVWPGDYSVERLDVTLLPPPGAADVQTDPGLSPVPRGADSFSYVGSFQNLAVGEAARVNVLYDGTQVAAPVRRPLAAVESTEKVVLGDGDRIQIIGGAVLVALFLAGAVVWYVRRPGPVPVPARRRSRSAPKARAQTSMSGVSGGGMFCTQCGQPVAQNDRFCESCGAAVKRRRDAGG